MTPMPSKRDKAKQFSLRALFIVTLAVCIVLAIVRLEAATNGPVYAGLLLSGVGALVGYLRTKSFRGFELGVAAGMIIWIATQLVFYFTF